MATPDEDVLLAAAAFIVISSAKNGLKDGIGYAHLYKRVISTVLVTF